MNSSIAPRIVGGLITVVLATSLTGCGEETGARTVDLDRVGQTQAPSWGGPDAIENGNKPDPRAFDPCDHAHYYPNLPC